MQYIASFALINHIHWAGVVAQPLPLAYCIYVMKIAQEKNGIRKPTSYLLSNYTTAICRVAFLRWFVIGTHHLLALIRSLTQSRVSIFFTLLLSIWWSPVVYFQQHPNAMSFYMPQSPTLQVSSHWIHCIDLKIASNSISTLTRTRVIISIVAATEWQLVLLCCVRQNRKNVKRFTQIHKIHADATMYSQTLNQRERMSYHELLVRIEVFTTEISELGMKSARAWFCTQFFTRRALNVHFSPL